VRFSLKSLTSSGVTDDPEFLLESWGDGNLPCSNCGYTVPLAGLPPLEFTRCPQCENLNITPLHINRFWLFEPLGGGGMGSVYKAYDSRNPQHGCAVKILPRPERKRVRPIQALINEMAVARAVGSHPCMAEYIASGYENGEYYLASAYIEGERIDKRLKRLEHLSEPEVILIALHLLSAEQHLYEAGYLYRDLKPENIIINPEGFAVLLDYGLSLPLNKARNPDSEHIAGSPYFMPPERLWGMEEDAYSEIYSLGLVMYFALTGQTLFDAKDVESLASKHVAKIRLSSAKKLQGVGPGLTKILTQMIQQDFKERYPSFAVLAAELYSLYQKLADMPPVPKV